MEIWLDSIDFSTIEEASLLGLLHGVTTNPSILSKSEKSAEEIIEKLVLIAPGPIAVQVTAKNAADMVEQGRRLYEFSQKVIVKIPATHEGIQAISKLYELKIPTMATAIFEPLQGFMSALAGAHYLAPYFSAMGQNALEKCQMLQKMLLGQKVSSKILLASVKTSDQIVQSILHGFEALTLPVELFHECLKAPSSTLDRLKQFEADWKSAPASKLLSIAE